MITEDLTLPITPLTWRQRMARSVVIKRLAKLKGDRLQMVDAEGRHAVGDESSSREPLELIVHHPEFYSRVLWGGDVGAAESLMDGDWNCSDLTRLIRLIIRSESMVDRLDRGLARIRHTLERFRHWLRRNTLQRSKSNIREHYDLGNEFFSLYLDPTMSYSCAIFDPLKSSEAPESLQRAQLRKIRRLCETLQLTASDHLLEIGTGWGSLACFAAKHYGCKVTTTTISHEQYLWATNRVQAEGLENRVTVLEQDYRCLEGQYDKVVSVEMIEAVGDQFYDTFFRQCQRLLKPDGLLLLQAITIVDQRYAKHLKSVDFICKYIFPGGSLPCISRLVESAAKAAEMRLVQLTDFAGHYPETLRRWRIRFWKQIDAIRGLGYSEQFIRMWDYYLTYCEAAFEERQINLVHCLFATRESRFSPVMVNETPSLAVNMSDENQFESLAVDQTC
jgi:cyclopropane-fatty-acyl-phospholipid synthase